MKNSGLMDGRTATPRADGAATRRCHLVGVAGVGMSALAQALVGLGRPVSGSDRYRDQNEDLPVLRRLEKAGVVLLPQDGSGVTPDVESVVVSTAVEESNPDVARAVREGVSLAHRAKMLAELIGRARCVAITGTCGKTTVTGMVGWVLTALGADPTVVNGGALVDWVAEDRVGSVRMGRSGLWVVEADESDRSLLRFHPEVALITNAAPDHFGLEETKELFERFARQTSGWVLRGWDEHAPWHGFEPRLVGWRGEFEYGGERFCVNLPGRHNAENALQAAVLCERMGWPLREIAEALASFRGIERRLEQVGMAKDVMVVDDYAHNPAKIAAAWNAARLRSRRVLAVWRPHGYRPLALMMEQLANTFERLSGREDRLYVLPVYYAGGTANRSMDSDVLVERLRTRGVEAHFAAEPFDALAVRVARELRPGDTVLVMGARDPKLPELARRILAALQAES